ncbi:restriction alleviation protein%2C Lar family [Achromobacter sp. 2789STDY5608633]|uniref:Lar family restriction alleviation protein n=1 Tax=Achromobacter sp. 2789STDY5608633 TaxID=1806501 RepID=UPI0006C53F31|nr:Lar family restriction alleviation protein [Achromobacter sp. 2789STDY5608633]CUJ48642.1 restriction alleviation protein%2C Lar family [Achromobacter sp. 2789STDY5608633]
MKTPEQSPTSTSISPCPFCHGSAKFMPFPVQREDKSGMVICSSKGCQAIGPKGESEFEAIDKWNRRVSQSDPAPPAAALDLQDFAARLLAPRDLMRDENGLLIHPLMPVFDEDINIEVFLSTFGLQVTYVGMESDDDPAIQEDMERYHAGEINCSFWEPRAPEGTGWVLLEIFDNEGSVHAMFVRSAPAATPTIRPSWITPNCSCERCSAVDGQLLRIRMYVCDVCGNKRCPHATDHRHACTGSNEPGQAGSSWEHVQAAAGPAGGDDDA